MLIIEKLDYINNICNNIYILTIGKFFPAAQLGYYTKAKQFQGIISRTPSNAIGTVAFPILSKLQNDRVALKNAMKKFIKYAVFFIAPLSAIFIVDGLNKGSQMTGIGITILVAVTTGFTVGKIIATLGRKTQPYDDIDEFEL